MYGNCTGPVAGVACGKRRTLAVQMSGLQRSISYQPGLDGVRALAIGAVLLYHSLPAALPGGFLGVEVFFVLSGYLITSLLLAEWGRHQRLDLPAFWRRRARRLLPALLALLLVALAFAAVWLPGEVAQLRGDVLAAVGYVANWRAVLEQRPYFEVVGRPPLLQHLWSLAVEEQFYLLWPLLLLAGLRWLPRPALLGLVLAGAAGSAALMAGLAQPDADPSRVYYGTDTRASGLLLGAALAFVWSVERPPARVHAGLLHLVGIGSLAALVVAGLRLGETAPLLYRGGFVAVDLATVGLLAVAVHPKARPEAWLLGLPPLRWLGERSYGLYLWHWPVVALTRPELDVPLDGMPLLLLRLGATIVLAELSYRFVELPVRTGALGRAYRRWRTGRRAQRWSLSWRRLGLAGAALGYTALVAPAVATAHPPQRPAYLAADAIDTWHVENQPAPTALAEVAVHPGDADAPPAAPPAAAPVVAAPAQPPAPPLATATPLGDPPATMAGLLDDPPAAPPPDGPAAATVAVPTPLDDPAADAPAPAPLGRVTAIGDSVMIGAATALQSALGQIEIDATVGRQVNDGLARLRTYRAAGQLGDVVVVQLGNNGTFTDAQADQLLDILADVRRVVLVTLKVPRVWEGPNNAVIVAAAQRASNVVLVDWHAAAVGHPELFYDDGMHLRPAGAAAYASLITEAATAP
jgi:peptidoglycan/LPS O-acetylase OafA/YrhL